MGKPSFGISPRHDSPVTPRAVTLPLAKELHPTQERVYVAAGIVRWVRGDEYGIETLEIDDDSQEDLDEYLWQQESESDESIP